MVSIPHLSRRRFLAGSAAALTAAGCNNAAGTNGAQRIDNRVDATRGYLFRTYPGTQDLETKSSAVLWMPLVSEAGFFVGGAYGTGALRIRNITVDYYEAIAASAGLQIGAQQYAHALFFMTPEALERFRTSPGWSAGADATYALIDQGGNLSAQTLTSLDPVIALVFGQTGLLVGATLEGIKYRRIVP